MDMPLFLQEVLPGLIWGSVKLVLMCLYELNQARYKLSHAMAEIKEPITELTITQLRQLAKKQSVKSFKQQLQACFLLEAGVTGHELGPPRENFRVLSSSKRDYLLILLWKNYWALKIARR